MFVSATNQSAKPVTNNHTSADKEPYNSEEKTSVSKKKTPGRTIQKRAENDLACGENSWGDFLACGEEKKIPPKNNS